MDINLQGFVFALILSVVSAAAFGQDETTCDCHIKDDKTSCSINDAADEQARCDCVKETMYGKRKYKAPSCEMVSDLNDQNSQ